MAKSVKAETERFSPSGRVSEAAVSYVNIETWQLFTWQISAAALPRRTAPPLSASCGSAAWNAPAAGEAGLVVLNTCTVTAAADQDARAAIRRIHRKNPDAQIVVTGCYAQRAPEEIAALPGVSSDRQLAQTSVG